MKKLKRLLALVSVVLCMSMVLGMGSVFASEGEGGGYDRVTISPELYDIPRYVIDDILKDNPKGDITIYSQKKADFELSPRIVLPATTTQTTTDSDVLNSDKFIISVARGASKKLTSSWKASLSASCSSIIVKPTLSLGATIECSYSKEETFDGPSEGSTYNSRTFRVKFYEDKGVYSVTNRITDMGHTLPNLYGTWTSPTYYYEYSVDMKV